MSNYDMLYAELAESIYYRYFHKPTNVVDQSLLKEIQNFSRDQLPSIIDDLAKKRFSPRKFNNCEFLDDIGDFTQRLRESKYINFWIIGFATLFIIVISQNFVDTVILWQPSLPQEFILKCIGFVLGPSMILVAFMGASSSLWSSFRPTNNEVKYVRNALDYKIHTRFKCNNNKILAIENNWLANRSINALISKAMMEYYRENRT